LQACCRYHLGIDLDKTDVEGVPAGQVQTLAYHALSIRRLFDHLMQQITSTAAENVDSRGCMSVEWLGGVFIEHGPLTHDIQLKAAIALRDLATTGGPRIVLEDLDAVRQRLAQRRKNALTVLAHKGYFSGMVGSSEILQHIMSELASTHPDTLFSRNPEGLYRTDSATLAELTEVDPWLQALIDYREAEELLASLTELPATGLIHLEYQALTSIGGARTPSVISPKVSALGPGLRDYLVPREGFVFARCDLSNVQTTAPAAACRGQFHLTSHVAALLDDGADVHRKVFADLAGKNVDEVTPEEAGIGKTLLLGTVGGANPEQIRNDIRKVHGIDLTYESIKRLSDWIPEMFPEMAGFLAPAPGEPNMLVAGFFGLTFEDHARRTGDDRLIRFRGPDEDVSAPSPILGGMFRNTLRSEHPTTRTGRAYSQTDIDYFWRKAEEHLHDLPEDVGTAVRARQPAEQLPDQIVRGIILEPVWTLTGRLRAKCSHAAQHQTLFRGPAADAAKTVLWDLWCAGYRITIFSDEEIVLEIPKTHAATEHLDTLRTLILDAIEKILPIIPIRIEIHIEERLST
jgi:hypothetical protein